MPADKEARPLASPWKEFLTELDGMLDEPLDADPDIPILIAAKAEYAKLN